MGDEVDQSVFASGVGTDVPTSEARDIVAALQIGLIKRCKTRKQLVFCVGNGTFS